jgi:hypothetical protein
MARESAGRGLESGLATGVMLHRGITVLCLDDRHSVAVVEEEDVDGTQQISGVLRPIFCERTEEHS